MIVDMAVASFGTRYKIMNSTITPRPIAWVTTRSVDGVLNCAPHSFFNALGANPAMLTLGLMKHPKTGGDKDTAANIRATREFTIGLVTEADAQVMNLTSADAPPEDDELALAGVATEPSRSVAPPIILSAPVSFECRLAELLDFPGQSLIVGEVLVTHIRDEFISDPERLHFDTPAMKLIARTHGSGWYARTSDQFQMDRPTYEDLQTRSGR